MDEEIVIWEGRPQAKELLISPKIWILSVASIGLLPTLLLLDRWTTRYKLTSQRVIIEKGIFFKTTDDIELYRVRDSKVTQGPFDRMLNVGTVSLQTTDATGKIEFAYVTDPRNVRELLRNASETLKRSRNIRIQTE